MSSSTFCLLGCGWLGFPLLQNLIKIKRFSNFKISFRRFNNSLFYSWIKKNKNIEPFFIDLPNRKSLSSFLKNCKTLFISIPPKVKKHEDIKYFDKKIDIIIQEVKKNPTLKEIFFISSTSVYPNNGENNAKNNGGKKVYEHSIEEILQNKIIEPDKSSGIALLKNEKKFLQNFINKKIIILRLAGLIGKSLLGDRSIKKIYNKKSNVYNHRVNLIPLKNCLAILELLIKKSDQLENGIYNICHDAHPTRKEILQKLNQKSKKDFYKIDKIEWIENNSYKIVDNSKIKKALNYSFNSTIF